MDRGYIKLWRKTLDSGILQSKNLWVFWGYCLLKASYRTHKQMVGFQEVTLQPGQFIFGRKAAASFLKMSEQEIRTSIVSLSKSKNLTIKSTNKFSIITILNWDIYQQPENEINQQINQQLTSNQPATNQQLTTNKNSKNSKKEKNTIYTFDFETFWKAYPKRIGKGAALKAWKKDGRPTLDVILKAIEDQKQSDQWTKDGGQFIPLPSTWLNQARWDDEPFKQEILKKQSTSSLKPPPDYEEISEEERQRVREKMRKDKEFLEKTGKIGVLK